MNVKTVALLYPGNMGSTIGAAAAASGARVVWASERRSKASRERAKQAGLIDVETLPNALGESDVVLSVCPPHAAVEVAEIVAQHNFKGIYVDANAISRATALRVGEIVSRTGASFVDGGIIGAPVKKAGTTRLYLSGVHAPEIAELFSSSMLAAKAIGPEPGAARPSRSRMRRGPSAPTRCCWRFALSRPTKASTRRCWRNGASPNPSSSAVASAQQRWPFPRCGVMWGRWKRSPTRSGPRDCRPAFIWPPRKFASGLRPSKIKPIRVLRSRPSSIRFAEGRRNRAEEWPNFFKSDCLFKTKLP